MKKRQGMAAAQSLGEGYPAFGLEKVFLPPYAELQRAFYPLHSPDPGAGPGLCFLPFTPDFAAFPGRRRLREEHAAGSGIIRVTSPENKASRVLTGFAGRCAELRSIMDFMRTGPGCRRGRFLRALPAEQPLLGFYDNHMTIALRFHDCYISVS